MGADAAARGPVPGSELRDAAAASASADLAAAGVGIEDKGPSIALHYRSSPLRDLRPCADPRALLAPMARWWCIFDGKMVVNAMPSGAPDKAAAVHALVQRCGAGAALFAGDDVNDEPVFAAAPPHWLTVRVGRDDPASRAQFFLDSTAEMAMLLERMLVLLSRIGPFQSEGNS